MNFTKFMNKRSPVVNRNLTDKEFFKIINKGCSEYSDQIEEGFPAWILKITFPFLTDDDIENAIYGLDRNDESIDAFFVNETTKDIYFVQCKSVRSERQLNSCKKEWLSYLYDVPNKLRNDEYIDTHKNSRVREIAADFSVYENKGYSQNFYFFHLGYLANERILDSYSSNSQKSLQYLGFDEIKNQYKEYESRISINEPEHFIINVSYCKKPEIINQLIGNHHTLISIITGDEIIRLRREYKYQLFDKNVRYNLGLNKINKTIVESAEKLKDDFYFYNNGLTITSTKFKPKSDDTVKVERPQIINGAQTVDSIYSAYKNRVNKLTRLYKNREKAEDQTLKEFTRLKVMFRIIQTNESENQFEINVIKCNNTQNAVQARDFYSNNIEQIELQKKFGEFGYFYEVKRGERNYIKKNVHTRLKLKLTDFKYSSEAIDIEKLASLFRAFKLEPNAKLVGAKNILNDDNAYQEIFGSSIADVTNEKVKTMILAYNLFDLLEIESKKLNKILSLLLHIDDRVQEFSKMQSLIESSLALNEIIKSKFRDIETYNKSRERHKKSIRKFSCFTQGKYFVLAIFSLILDECDYLNKLTNTELFTDKNFIKKNIVEMWLPTILQKILVRVYEKAFENDGMSISAFYLRPKSFEKIWDTFEQLDVDEDRQLVDIFPLKFN